MASHSQDGFLRISCFRSLHAPHILKICQTVAGIRIMASISQFFYVYFLGSGKTVWAVNEFAFSPCGHFLAVASQDGFLRIFNYDTMEPVGRARSYFGGFLCVCWSPDGKYVVCGGEDDLVTARSLQFFLPAHFPRRCW